jgi:hypothetical protein
MEESIVRDVHAKLCDEWYVQSDRLRILLLSKTTFIRLPYFPAFPFTGFDASAASKKLKSPVFAFGFAF